MSSDACKRHCYVGVYSGVFWNVFRSTYRHGHLSQLLQTSTLLPHYSESRNRWHWHRTSIFLGVLYRIDNEYLLFTLLGSLAKNEQTRDCIPWPHRGSSGCLDVWVNGRNCKLFNKHIFTIVWSYIIVAVCATRVLFVYLFVCLVVCCLLSCQKTSNRLITATSCV